MKRYVLGDIHGAFQALIQVLKQAKFDYKKDQLIFLGDVVDGWPDSKECIDELLKIKNLVPLLGNHDKWCWDWMKSNWQGEIWLSQGGQATLDSYQRSSTKSSPFPKSHLKYFENALPYYLTDSNQLFVHAGIEVGVPLENQDLETLIWDRSLYQSALARKFTEKRTDPLTTYKEIYIGHTSTERFSLTPLQCCEVWLLDQGAGWGGRLTLMDIDSNQYWQSDPVTDLYPGHPGRRG